MTVMDSLTAKDIEYEVASQINKEASVMTDGFKSYSKLYTIVNEHKVLVVKDKKQIAKIFP